MVEDGHHGHSWPRRLDRLGGLLLHGACRDHRRDLHCRITVSIDGALSLPAVTAIIAEEGRELGSGSTVGVFNTAMSIGQIVGPVFSGFLLDTYGMGSVFYFSGFISVISVLSFLGLSRTSGVV